MEGVHATARILIAYCHSSQYNAHFTAGVSLWQSYNLGYYEFCFCFVCTLLICFICRIYFVLGALLTVAAILKHAASFYLVVIVMFTLHL